MRAPFFCALDALAINDAGGRTGLEVELFAAFDIESVMDAIQGSVPAPIAEIAIHRALGRQILGDVAPLTSRAQHIHQAVHQIALVNLAPAPAATRRTEEQAARSPATPHASVKSLG